jgi:hypothetical protein
MALWATAHSWGSPVKGRGGAAPWTAQHCTACAIDQQIRAGDERAGRRGEEGYRIGDVSNLSDTAE